jgi:hypothetical protein
LTIHNLEQPGFIDTLFQFREEHRQRGLLNEDECFSRDVCDISDQKVKCERCREYVNCFEDVEAAFRHSEGLEGYIKMYLKDLDHKIDTGYLMIHTQWVIDYLGSG